jgi:hypothetical protein
MKQTRRHLFWATILLSAGMLVEGIGVADHNATGDMGSRQAPDPGATKEAEPLSSAERLAEDGRIEAFGHITALGAKDGHRYLSIDYGEWISEPECRRRVAAGTLTDLDESDCEVDALRYVNQNPRVREFEVAQDVEISIQRPSAPPRPMSWEGLSKLFRDRNEQTRELWDGLWRIGRRGKQVERIDWVYTP